jgi:hypothetical protein
MLGQLFSLHFGFKDMNVLELQEMALQSPAIPKLIFSHDGPANLMTAEELLANDKQDYANKRVVLLVRDPADVVVSYYFEYTRRRTVFNPAQFNPFDGNISTFLRQERGGLDSILAFYQQWAEHKHVPASFLLVRYEDMHTAPKQQLRRFLDFIGLQDVDDALIDDAVEYGRFDNMRQLEQHNRLNSERLRPGNPDDPESYKTRSGQIGAYTKYLTPADIDYIAQKRQQIPSMYGYAHSLPLDKK